MEQSGKLKWTTKLIYGVGDIGNARTWPFPVQYKVVRGATPAEMVNLKGSDVLAPLRPRRTS